MARPKKQTNVYSHRFPTVQCTEDMLIQAKSQADARGLRYSDYARQALTEGQINEAVNNNDQSPLGQAFSRYFKDDIGKQLNKATHRANSAGVLPESLKLCLVRLAVDLDFLLYASRIYEEHGRVGEEEILDTPRHIFDQNFAHQLTRVGTNLVQLIRIAEQTEDSRIDILKQCYGKLEPLIDRIISDIN